MTIPLLPIFTERDFDLLSWDNNRIHAMAFNPESRHLVLDIDYIFNWKDVKNVANRLVGPATLIFDNVHNFSIQASAFESGLNIESLSRQALNFSSGAEFLWLLIVDGGQICFVAKGFTQFNRRRPIISVNNSLSIHERGGISFNTKLSV